MSERLTTHHEEPVTLTDAQSLLHKEFAEQIGSIDSSSEKTSLFRTALFMTELDTVMDHLLTSSAHNQMSLESVNADLQNQAHIPNSTKHAMLTYTECFLKENEKTKQLAQRYKPRDLYKIITGGRNLRTRVDQSVFGTALLWEFHSDFPMKAFFEKTDQNHKNEFGEQQAETIANVRDYTIDEQNIRIIVVKKMEGKRILVHEQNHEKYALFITPVDKSLTLDETIEKDIIKTADEFIAQIYSYWLENLKSEAVAYFTEGLTPVVFIPLPSQRNRNHKKLYNIIELSSLISCYNYPKEYKKEAEQLFVKYFEDSKMTDFDKSYEKITDQYEEFKHSMIPSLCDLFKGYTQKEKEQRNSNWTRPYTVFVDPLSTKIVKTIFSLFVLYPIEQWGELIEKCQRSFLVYDAEKNIYFMPERLGDDIEYDENGLPVFGKIK